VLRERGRWRDIQIPGAAVSALLPPVDIGGTSPRMDAVPAVGEHTDAILGELGYAASDIEALRADRII
jgi:formyl-CoA transferase